jgi:hypothetical protein
VMARLGDAGGYEPANVYAATSATMPASRGRNCGSMCDALCPGQRRPWAGMAGRRADFVVEIIRRSDDQEGFQVLPAAGSSSAPAG